MIKPFSENIIFFDTEFTNLDPNRAELISIGLVKPNGDELYLELDYKDEPSEWVKENALPYLNGQKVNSKEAIRKVKEFVGDSKPYIVGYINQDDVIYWQKLYVSVTGSVDGYPFQIASIDFGAILFMLGIDPDAYYSGDENDFLKKLDIDYKKYKKHNALDDAKLLREVYVKFIGDPQKFINQIKE